jgi:hypothetical protein
MKAPLTLAEIAGSDKEPVLIRSCPLFDLYCTAKRPTDAVRRELKKLGTAWLEAPPVKRIKHAVKFREKQMAATLSSRKRPRGANEKERMYDLMKHIRVRLLASVSPDDLIRLVQSRPGRDDFVDRAIKAYAEGVNPLFDIADWLIMSCWDRLDPIFRGPFYCGAYVDKELPGLKKWHDRAAAAFVAFVLGDLRFYLEEKRATHDPFARPYHLYKKRRQNLDLHPDKPLVITGADWDRSKPVLHLASEADGWAWELKTFYCQPFLRTPKPNGDGIFQKFPRVI